MTNNAPRIPCDSDPPCALLTPRFQDILTGDEVISDSYDMKEVDNIVYEADCAMITLGAVEVGMSRSSLSHLKDVSMDRIA